MTGQGLEGLRVIELGGGFAASMAGRVLADIGAEVVKVEPPEGDPLRHLWGGGSFLHLNANKRGVTLDRARAADRATFERLLGRADLVLREGAPSELDDAEEWRTRHPSLVVVSITPFGLSGPRRDWRATDLTLMHAGGWGYIIPGRGAPIEWPPIRPFGHHALLQAGLHAAVPALAACRVARATGAGEHIDVAVQEAVTCLLGRHFTSWEYAGLIDHRSARSIYEPVGFYPCRDGDIFIICAEQDQWGRLLEVMDDVEWGSHERFSSRDGRGENWLEIRERIGAWTAARDTEEVFHTLQAVRVGAAPVYDHASLERHEHLRARDFFVPLEHPDGQGKVTMLGAPYRLRRPWWRLARPAPVPGEANADMDALLASSPAPARASGDNGGASASDMPLRGVRVLDLSWVWAGPHCTLLLGALGAEVLKVESSGRLDLTRRASLYARDLPPGPNRNGYFNQLAQNKKSVGIDLSGEEGRALALRLAAKCDVFVANFGTGVLERMGLGPDDLLAVNPDIAIALVSAFGQDGPLRRYTGYGPLISPIAGLSVATGYAEDGRPRDVHMAYGDPNGGVYAAIAVVAALLARDAHGERGQVIDVAMWEAMTWTSFEGWMNHALGGAPFTPMGNRDPANAPCNVYPCRDEDSWIAIEAPGETEWQALCRTMGRPELATAPEYATAAARKANEDALDRIIANWCRTRDRWAATELLQAVGVPAFPSMSSADLRSDPHLEARHAFNRFEHPEVGVRTHLREPWRWTERANGAGRPAPCLGEHTDEAMRELLGLSEEDIADLRARGIIE